MLDSMVSRRKFRRSLTTTTVVYTTKINSRDRPALRRRSIGPSDESEREASVQLLQVEMWGRVDGNT